MVKEFTGENIEESEKAGSRQEYVKPRTPLA